MSTPVFDPADFDLCDEHQNAFVRGSSCVHCDPPSLTTEQARDYAKTWSDDNGGGSGFVIFDAGLTREQTEQLFAWVRATMPSMYGRSMLRRAQSLAALLNRGLSDDQAQALRRAAGWPS